MSPVLVLVVVAALVLLATALGLVWTRRQGRASAVRQADALDPSFFGPTSGGTTDARGGFGERATLVQFSTAFCSGCPATRRVLSGISERTAGVAYLDVDVTDRADLVRRFGILQTPTTLILDRHGVVRTRIGGVVRPGVVAARLEEFA